MDASKWQNPGGTHLPQGTDRDEAAEVETVGRGIEADIDGAASFVEIGVEVVGGGGIQEAAPAQLIEKGARAIG